MELIFLEFFTSKPTRSLVNNVYKAVKRLEPLSGIDAYDLPITLNIPNVMALISLELFTSGPRRSLVNNVYKVVKHLEPLSGIDAYDLHIALNVPNLLTLISLWRYETLWEGM